MTRNASAGGISWEWTTAMAAMQNSNPASRRTIFIGERNLKANLVPRGSCGDVQQACRVSVVNLLQNCLGKLNSVDSPASLGWNVRWSIVEVFVPSLQEAVIDFVQLVVEDLLRCLIAMWCSVRPEEDAILVFVEEPACGSRLPAQLSDSGRNIDGHVGIAIEAVGYIAKILREVSGVESNELCFRMSSEYAVSRVQQLGIAGEIVTIEGPVRMIVKFFVALVVAIRRSKESNGIRNVNGDWHVQLPTRIPHRIKARVIYFDQLARGDVLAQIEAERLQNFQTLGSRAMRSFNGFSLKTRIVWFQEPGVRRLGKAVKAIGEVLVIPGNHIGEAVAEASRQVNHAANVFAVHDGE